MIGADGLTESSRAWPLDASFSIVLSPLLFASEDTRAQAMAAALLSPVSRCAPSTPSCQAAGPAALTALAPDARRQSSSPSKSQNNKSPLTPLQLFHHLPVASMMVSTAPTMTPFLAGAAHPWLQHQMAMEVSTASLAAKAHGSKNERVLVPANQKMAVAKK